MRFIKNGLIIPSHLLRERDKGNVVFFCGAGVSRRAGLPDFGGLTQKVAEKLRAKEALAAMERGNSFDRIFSLLVRKFDQFHVDKEIYSALKAGPKPDLSCHETILKLSRDVDGRPQIVTTNFDLLFEAAEKGISWIIPPNLPDLSPNQPINGLVYLHGRLQKPEGRYPSNYVISSADFGRAYLSEAWATRFVKALRERYTIVLLGYRAEDPPMHYLLEGLNASNKNYNSLIYAFTEGKAGNAAEEWDGRGITAICYEKSDNHEGLWDTLSAWADAVRNPEEWTQKVVGLAQKRPTEVTPHERGQVVELVSSKHGAMRFAGAEPAPSAEWMCVFDPSVRYGEPKKQSQNDEEEIDPLDLFGLDDDPPRLPKEANGQRTIPGFNPQEANGQRTIPGFNPLTWQRDDDSSFEQLELRNWNSQWANPLPERLRHIAKWFGDVMHEPVAVWWASGFERLSPNMLWFVLGRLQRDQENIPPQAVTFWKLYLESCAQDTNYGYDTWNSFQQMIKNEGWSNAALRFFERIFKPHVVFSRKLLGRSYPVELHWDGLPLLQLVDAEVRVLDRHSQKLEIPNEQLKAIIAIVRRSLVETSHLHEEIGIKSLDMPTLHPTGEPGVFSYEQKALHFLWFRDLFVRLVESGPEAAALEVGQWPINDGYFFGKLYIYAAMFDKVVSANQTTALLSELNDKIFWEPSCQREILFTLRARWPHFTSTQRGTIEHRIAKGPMRWGEEKAADFRRRRAAAERLAWLKSNGCPLTPATAKKLEALKGVDPNWSDDWAGNADRSLDSRSGMVERVTDTRGIESAPIGRILDEARSKTESRHGELRDFRPFDGLVQKHPGRAFAALRCALKKDEAPENQFWTALLSQWPDDTSLGLRWRVAHTVSTLSVNTPQDLSSCVARWFQKNLQGLVEADRPRALAILDKVIEIYAPPDVNNSSADSTTISGVTQHHSGMSGNAAINSSVGILAQALLQLVPQPSFKNGPMPDGMGERFDILFRAAGAGGGHAAYVVAKKFPWLDCYHSDWSDRVLRPMFDLEHRQSQAVWKGFAGSECLPDRDETRRFLAPFLLRVLGEKQVLSLDEAEKTNLVQKMVYLTERKSNGGRVISFNQAHEVLVALDDRGRTDAIEALKADAADAKKWESFVKPFIEKAWPLEVKYRTESASRSFANLIMDSGNNFPDAVKTILSLMGTVTYFERIKKLIPENSENGTKCFAERFPKQALQFLDAVIPNNRAQMPPELGNILEVISKNDPKLKNMREWQRLNELSRKWP